MDFQKRITIPKEFRESEGKNVYYYYSPNEKMFTILFEEETTKFCIGIRSMDSKGRVHIPKEIVDFYKATYGAKDVFIGKKDNQIYLIPV